MKSDKHKITNKLNIDIIKTALHCLFKNLFMVGFLDPFSFLCWCLNMKYEYSDDGFSLYQFPFRAGGSPE